MLSWDHIVYSTQWPIYWDRLDESKFIEKKEARIKYDKGDYRHLTFCQYRDYDRHYNFRGGTAYMTIYGDVPGGDRSYRGTYDQDSLETLSISFDDCRSLFDHQAKIRELVEGIRFVEYKTARQRKRRTIKE